MTRPTALHCLQVYSLAVLPNLLPQLHTWSEVGPGAGPLGAVPPPLARPLYTRDCRYD